MSEVYSRTQREGQVRQGLNFFETAILIQCITMCDELRQAVNGSFPEVKLIEPPIKAEEARKLRPNELPKSYRDETTPACYHRAFSRGW